MKNKRNFIIYYVCACLSVLFLSLVYSAFDNVYLHTAEAQVNSSAGEKAVIILDAGHGGEDGGAVSINGDLEKDINLDITLTLKDFLVQSGFEVKTIRDEDISIHDEGAAEAKNRKTSDLKNRLQIYNENENNIVLSIHQNKFSESKYSGAQIFYSKNTAQSSVLAESIKSSVCGLLQPNNTRECKPADKNIFLLHNAEVPAVIVECGFLSNSEEARLLTQKDYRNKMAFSIYLGFLEYYNTSY